MDVLVFHSIENVGPAQEALTSVGRDHTYSLISGLAIGAAGSVLLADGILAGADDS